MKEIHWIKNAYKGTNVHWARSQAKIMQMLNDIGITQIRFTSLEDRFVLEFMVKFDEKSVPRAIRIITPIKTRINDDPAKRNKELNIIHRILLNHLRAKFIAIGNGLTEFEQEFMSHLVVTDKTGKSATMGELLLPQYEKNLEDKTTPKFLLGDGK